MRAIVVDTRIKNVLPNNEVFSTKSLSKSTSKLEFVQKILRNSVEKDLTFDMSYQKHGRKFNEKASAEETNEKFLEYDRYSRGLRNRNYLIKFVLFSFCVTFSCCNLKD